jgi:hypothetical protein
MDVQHVDLEEKAVAELNDLRRRLALARSDEKAEIAQTRSDLARIGAKLRRFAGRPWVPSDAPAPTDE